MLDKAALCIANARYADARQLLDEADELLAMPGESSEQSIVERNIEEDARTLVADTVGGEACLALERLSPQYSQSCTMTSSGIRRLRNSCATLSSWSNDL